LTIGLKAFTLNLSYEQKGDRQEKRHSLLSFIFTWRRERVRLSRVQFSRERARWMSSEQPLCIFFSVGRRVEEACSRERSEQQRR